MNKIVFKLHTLAKPKIISANKGKLQEEVVIITVNLRGFKTCGAKKTALQTISHNCGSGFSDKYQDLWICAKFIRDCLVGHGQPTCSAKSLFYSHLLAGISNLIVLNYPTVWDK